MKITAKALFALPLACLLALSMFACGDKTATTGGDVSESSTTSEAIVDTTAPVEESSTNIPEAISATTETTVDTTTGTAATTVLNATTTTGVATTTGTTKPVETTKFDPSSKKSVLAYFNTAANLVRTEKPQFHLRSVNKIETLKAGAIPTGITNSVVKTFMPGDPKDTNVSKGSSNTEQFLARESSYASALKESQVTSFKVSKDGANDVITLNIKNETNPIKGKSTAYGSIFDFETPAQLLEELEGTATADVNNVTLKYNSGYVKLIIDPNGHVVGSTTDFYTDAHVTDAKLFKIYKADVDAHQHSLAVCDKFVW
jgi:hypothetical protein